MKTGVDEKAKEGQGARLERTVGMTIAGVCFLAGLYFLSPGMTGNVIGSMDTTKTSIIGIALVAMSILGYYFISKFLDN